MNLPHMGVPYGSAKSDYQIHQTAKLKLVYHIDSLHESVTRGHHKYESTTWAHHISPPHEFQIDQPNPDQSTSGDGYVSSLVFHMNLSHESTKSVSYVILPYYVSHMSPLRAFATWVPNQSAKWIQLVKFTSVYHVSLSHESMWDCNMNPQH